MTHTVYNASRYEDSFIECPVCMKMAIHMIESDTYVCTDCDYESECVSDNPDNFVLEA